MYGLLKNPQKRDQQKILVSRYLLSL